MMLLKTAIRAAIPVGLLDLRRAWQKRRAKKEQLLTRFNFHDLRRQRIDTVSNTFLGTQFKADNYERVVAFLVEAGVTEHHIRDGSIPFDSLKFINDTVISKLNPNRPSFVLHIGNFVGVSLAYLTGKIVDLNSQSVVVAIDPNITHRGIANPQSLAMKLLCSCGLQRNVIPITGFSIGKNISNDGVIFENYDPVQSFLEEASCEKVLDNLSLFFNEQFDVACLDGNHEATYLQREIESILPLIKRDGWMIFDDVDQGWPEIQDVFKRVARGDWTRSQAMGVLV